MDSKVAFNNIKTQTAPLSDLLIISGILYFLFDCFLLLITICSSQQGQLFVQSDFYLILRVTVLLFLTILFFIKRSAVKISDALLALPIYDLWGIAVIFFSIAWRIIQLIFNICASYISYDPVFFDCITMYAGDILSIALISVCLYINGMILRNRIIKWLAPAIFVVYLFLFLLPFKIQIGTVPSGLNETTALTITPYLLFFQFAPSLIYFIFGLYLKSHPGEKNETKQNNENKEKNYDSILDEIENNSDS